MAKDIVLLDVREQQGGISTIRCVFWIPVTNGYPAPTITSAYPAISQTDAAVFAQLQAGTMLEEVQSFAFPTSAIETSWSTVELIILAFYQARKNYRAGTVSPLLDPGAKYQVSHDSVTGWSA